MYMSPERAFSPNQDTQLQIGDWVYVKGPAFGFATKPSNRFNAHNGIVLDPDPRNPTFRVFSPSGDGVRSWADIRAEMMRKHGEELSYHDVLILHKYRSTTLPNYESYYITYENVWRRLEEENPSRLQQVVDEAAGMTLKELSRPSGIGVPVDLQSKDIVGIGQIKRGHRMPTRKEELRVDFHYDDRPSAEAAGRFVEYVSETSLRSMFGAILVYGGREWQRSVWAEEIVQNLRPHFIVWSYKDADLSRLRYESYDCFEDVWSPAGILYMDLDSLNSLDDKFIQQAVHYCKRCEKKLILTSSKLPNLPWPVLGNVHYFNLDRESRLPN